MADRRIPESVYEYEIGRLTDAYTKAMYRIAAELQRMDLTEISRTNSAVALAEIVRILKDMNGESSDWIIRNLPVAATDGVVNTIMALGVAQTVDEAQKIAKFNRINKNMVDAAIADTQADLLAVTQNVERRVRAAVRQVTADAMRANMARGVNGRRTISADILQGLRKRLDDSVNTGIIDAAGRRWKPEVYVDMLVRTKQLETFREATTNEAVARGAFYAVISSHGAKDACRFHEGRIIKLTPDAPGNYPTYAELRGTGQIWHPNCKHTFTPMRNPDRLPESERNKSEWARVKDGYRDKIRSGAYPMDINAQKQNRHIEGTFEFERYVQQLASKNLKPSALRMSAEDIVKRYAGKGDIRYDKPTDLFPREIVRASSVVGEYFDPKEKRYKSTRNAMIVYSKTGIHVYPFKEDGD